MDPRAFIELQYQAMKAYLASLVNSNEVKEEKLNWEHKLPIGRMKLEHYRKACEMLESIINDTVGTTVLFIPASFAPVIAFGEHFYHYGPEDDDVSAGAYEALGTLGKTVVVIDPNLAVDGELSMLLIDLSKKQPVHITQGKYDYAADLSALSAEEWQKEREEAHDKGALED